MRFHYNQDWLICRIIPSVFFAAGQCEECYCGEINGVAIGIDFLFWGMAIEFDI